MRVRMLRSSTAGEVFQFAASYLINDNVVIDAGSLGFALLDDQRRVGHVFLSHGHLDHIATLPIFLENIYQAGNEAPFVYAGREVLDSLQTNVFNDRLWPDVSRLCKEANYVRFATLESGRVESACGLRITPIPLNHIVPCFGFLIEDVDAAVVLASDTGPTEEIWSRARRLPHLKAVFLEAAFPNAYEWLAEKATHLTPNQFLGEYRKLGRDVPMFAVHIKSGFYQAVVGELGQLGIPDLIIAEPDRLYEF